MNYLTLMLQNLAIEKAMYKLDLEGAVQLLMDGSGCNREIALSIISNKNSFAGEDQQISLVKREELSESDAKATELFDPIITINKIAQEVSGELRKSDFYKSIDWMHLTVSDIERWIIANKTFAFDTTSEFDGIKGDITMYLYACDIVLDLQKHLDFQEDHDMISNRGELEKFLFFLKKAYEFKDKKQPYLDLLSFCRTFALNDEYKEYLNGVTEQVIWLGGLWDNFEDLANRYKDGSVVSNNQNLNSPIDAHLDGSKNLKDIANNFKEANIQDKYDAGWLSPKGKFYGINGVVSNMLHLNLADIIVSELFGLEYCDDPELELESKNWVKITGNWVLFAGYTKMIPASLTNAQKEAIIELGKTYDDVVLLGWDKHSVRIQDLELMTDEQIEKPFQF